jgi:hypothetical protein
VPSCPAAPVCAFTTIPCFIACGNPPKVSRKIDAALFLRSERYGKLNWIDRSTALFTTQMGKCLGINGWRQYKLHVAAVGIIDQAATSWDGLRTVDITLEKFNDSIFGPGQTRYIRAEIIRHVWKHLGRPLLPGDHIQVEGELHWDGHGFLEIHPSQVDDVRTLSKALLPTVSPNIL